MHMYPHQDMHLSATCFDVAHQHEVNYDGVVMFSDYFDISLVNVIIVCAILRVII